MKNPSTRWKCVKQKCVNKDCHSSGRLSNKSIRTLTFELGENTFHFSHFSFNVDVSFEDKTVSVCECTIHYWRWCRTVEPSCLDVVVCIIVQHQKIVSIFGQETLFFFKNLNTKVESKIISGFFFLLLFISFSCCRLPR